jgi:hypothetical protein
MLGTYLLVMSVIFFHVSHLFTFPFARVVILVSLKVISLV